MFSASQGWPRRRYRSPLERALGMPSGESCLRATIAILLSGLAGTIHRMPPRVLPDSGFTWADSPYHTWPCCDKPAIPSNSPPSALCAVADASDGRRCPFTHHAFPLASILILGTPRIRSRDRPLKFQRAHQQGLESGGALGAAPVFDGEVEGAALADQDDELFGPGQGGVEQG